MVIFKSPRTVFVNVYSACFYKEDTIKYIYIVITFYVQANLSLVSMPNCTRMMPKISVCV